MTEEFDKILYEVKLRRGRVGTIKEQQDAKRRYRKKMREMNKVARDAGYGKGINQAREELL
jgi:hypothetical protein